MNTVSNMPDELALPKCCPQLLHLQSLLVSNAVLRCKEVVPSKCAEVAPSGGGRKCQKELPWDTQVLNKPFFLLEKTNVFEVTLGPKKMANFQNKVLNISQCCYCKCMFSICYVDDWCIVSCMCQEMDMQFK